MTDPDLRVEDLTRWLLYYRPARPGLHPATLRCSHATWRRLVRTRAPEKPWHPDPVQWLGVPVDYDDTFPALPAGVWRLHAADGALLRDNRPGEVAA
jgi:hypothetical protein